MEIGSCGDPNRMPPKFFVELKVGIDCMVIEIITLVAVHIVDGTV